MRHPVAYGPRLSTQTTITKYQFSLFKSPKFLSVAYILGHVRVAQGKYLRNVCRKDAAAELHGRIHAVP